MRAARPPDRRASITPAAAHRSAARASIARRAGLGFLWEWTKIFAVVGGAVPRHPHVPRRGVQDSERQHGEHAAGRRLPAREQARVRRRGAVHAQAAAAASRAAARRRDRVRVARGPDEEFREAARRSAGRHARDARRHADPERRARSRSGTSSTPSRTSIPSPEDFRWQRDYPRADRASAPSAYHPSRNNWGPLVVPEGNYFVLGDNRDNSLDSRYWGFVADSLVKGRPFVIYYSYAPDSRRRLRLAHAHPLDAPRRAHALTIAVATAGRASTRRRLARTARAREPVAKEPLSVWPPPATRSRRTKKARSISTSATSAPIR